MPSTLLDGGLIAFNGKADPEDEAYIAAVHNQQPFVSARVQSQPDWGRFLQNIPKNTSKIAIAQFLLEPKLSDTMVNNINQSTDTKAMVIEVVSTPEYQLC